VGELKRFSANLTAPYEERAAEATTPCPVCREPGTWEPERPCPDCQEKTAAAELTRRRREDWRGSLAAIGVPLAYRSVPLDLRLRSELRGWAGSPWAVTLLGNTGTGKTWQAVRLLAGAYCSGRDGAIFADASLALEAMRQEIDSRDDKGKTLRRLICAPALLLDDLTGPRDTDYARDRFVLLLRERYNRQLPTIITSNKRDLAELAEERLDAAVGSRLATGIVLTLTGKDRRLEVDR
jgi:hypothetical protein